MDEQSGESEEEEVMGEKNSWVGNGGTGTRIRLAKRWSWFQRQDEA